MCATIHTQFALNDFHAIRYKDVTILEYTNAANECKTGNIYIPLHINLSRPFSLQ